jgi:hypothetical protein
MKCACGARIEPSKPCLADQLNLMNGEIFWTMRAWRLTPAMGASEIQLRCFLA